MPDLIDDWLLAWAEWTDADVAGRGTVRARNLMIDKVWSLGREIAARDELHDSINALCEPGRDPDTRVHAALVREHWDVAGAAETLVSVIATSGASVARPVTMSEALRVSTTKAASTAALCLLNIDSGRGNTGAKL